MGIKHSEYYFTYHPAVLKTDIPRLDRVISDRIKLSIERKLGSDPILYGLLLRGSLRGYWKLRVGDYRVIYRVIKAEVRIFAVGHRSDVYEMVGRRI